MAKPLEMQFEIVCSVEHAFRVWSEQIDSWWPKSHSRSGEQNFSVTMEPFVGGRIFERTATGAEFDWGEVLEWQPPSRIRFLWHIAWERSKATNVTVTFIPKDESTIVNIEQTGWENFGSDAENFRNRNYGGWTAIIEHFNQLASIETSNKEPRT